MLRVPRQSVAGRQLLRIPTLHKTRVRPARRADKNFPAHTFNETALATNANAMIIGTFSDCAPFVSNYFKRAGWSSLVARQAHNLKVAGSNPAPATNFSPSAVLCRVYVIQNREGKFYIGLSDDVGRRINQHKVGVSKWTRSRGPWALMWQSAEMNLSDARKLELLLKRQKGGDGFYRMIGRVRSGT